MVFILLSFAQSIRAYRFTVTIASLSSIAAIAAGTALIYKHVEIYGIGSHTFVMSYLFIYCRSFYRVPKIECVRAIVWSMLLPFGATKSLSSRILNAKYMPSDQFQTKNSASNYYNYMDCTHLLSSSLCHESWSSATENWLSDLYISL